MVCSAFGFLFPLRQGSDRPFILGLLGRCHMKPREIAGERLSPPKIAAVRHGPAASASPDPATRARAAARIPCVHPGFAWMSGRSLLLLLLGGRWGVKTSSCPRSQLFITLYSRVFPMDSLNPCGKRPGIASIHYFSPCAQGAGASLSILEDPLSPSSSGPERLLNSRSI